MRKKFLVKLSISKLWWKSNCCEHDKKIDWYMVSLIPHRTIWLPLLSSTRKRRTEWERAADQMQGNMWKKYTEEGITQMIKYHWLEHSALSFVVSSLHLGEGSPDGSKSGSLPLHTRASPLVKIFIPFIISSTGLRYWFSNHYLPRKIAYDEDDHNISWSL